MPDTISVSTPGRICLFGEHQDYLSLPVIPAAISLRLTITGSPAPSRLITLHMPDIGSVDSFSLDTIGSYRSSNDYMQSVINVLQRNGFTLPHGLACTIRSRIPIRAGTSSSSALVVAWTSFVGAFSTGPCELEPKDVARFAYEAEVLEFNEAGGMMDQYSTALGGIVALEFEPSLRIERLPARLGTFVLGDSLEPKDTQGILRRVKERIQQIVRRLSLDAHFPPLARLSLEDIAAARRLLDDDEFHLLRATVHNHHITREAMGLLRSEVVDEHTLGRLLNDHHAELRDGLKISTPRIDRMLDAALEAGATGGKINGSGGGGCMFVYVPSAPETVASAIERAGGKAYIVHIDAGTRIEYGA